MTYQQKLQDGRWQRKRLELLEAANWACEYCGKSVDHSGTQLHIHHLHYFRNTEPWEYPNYLYVALCKDCHFERQEAETRLYSSIAIATRLIPGRRLDEIAKRIIPEAFKEMGDA